MNMEFILEELGLIPFEEYAADPNRKSLGLTTKLLCRLLLDLSNAEEGEIFYLLGHSRVYTKTLCNRARGYAKRLGLSHDSIQPLLSKNSQPRKKVYTDHFLAQYQYVPRHVPRHSVERRQSEPLPITFDKTFFDGTSS